MLYSACYPQGQTDDCPKRTYGRHGGSDLIKRPPQLAALLLLFGVKRSLLGFHLLYQFLDPIEGKLIGDTIGQALVVLDLAVDLNTFVTHRSSAFARGQPDSCRLGRHGVADLVPRATDGKGQCQLFTSAP